jgi:hypothetical protein
MRSKMFKVIVASGFALVPAVAIGCGSDVEEQGGTDAFPREGADTSVIDTFPREGADTSVIDTFPREGPVMLDADAEASADDATDATDATDADDTRSDG